MGLRDNGRGWLERFGGASGIREPGLVESAVESARHVFGYGRGDLFEIAAAYAFHLAESQSFTDGNKRTAVSAAISFLRLNGKPFPKDDGSVYRAMIEIAEKQLDQRGLVETLRRWVESAKEKWEIAKAEGDLETAYKYAQASSRVKPEIVEDSKYLLNIMGIPFVQAPSEGEAQAAHMILKKDANCIASQDYDSLLFGAQIIIRNLAVTGKRKLPGKDAYVNVEPEIIELEDTLSNLGINREQLIDIAICVGTDYNKGLKKVGPKTALMLIKKYGDIYTVLRERGEEIEDLDKIRELFIHPEVTDDYKIKWKKPDSEKLIEFLCDKHGFSVERIEKAIERLKTASATSQKTLEQWF